MREEKPDQSSSISITGWFAYMSALLSALALRTISFAKNVSSPEQGLKCKHMGFSARVNKIKALV